MRISIFSDSHCGFAYGEERGEDSFDALQEAVEQSRDADLILIAGDLFDARTPRQEVLARTAKILAAEKAQTKAKFLEIINKEKHEVSPLALRGIPIVAIHGTHERRAKQMINPVQTLEHAGLLMHLHCATAVFEIDGKRVAIHGMSGVPERYAKEILLQWNPKPLESAINILLLHQSIEPYIYSPLEPPSLRLEDLPDGFDLYVLGHIHWHDCKKFKSGLLLLPGSIVPTTLHKIESEQEKSVWLYNGANAEQRPLSSQRKIYYEDFDYASDVKKQMQQKISNILQQPHLKKPIFVAKINGKLEKGASINFSDIESNHSDKIILNIIKNLQSEEFEEQTELMRLLREQRLSAEEQGLLLLKKNLEQTKCGIRVEEIFDLLVDGNTDAIFNLLTGKQSTLSSLKNFIR